MLVVSLFCCLADLPQHQYNRDAAGVKWFLVFFAGHEVGTLDHFDLTVFIVRTNTVDVFFDGANSCDVVFVAGKLVEAIGATCCWTFGLVKGLVQTSWTLADCVSG